ncbi:hypothetical protein J31TS4_23600 [Paenibacillus sp. J31TS4]|uniref:hypothetical protein n=1 Tax=Paenibacillus sp. J31TS4 TaxID=2807195 RepID=UPI001B201C02|nr:hypothetical protein [Paenibacillus sp. J31TS4]GIP39080.1 hypothetical protein J31TS4_23600 [Paenibacillus sp. J31TS4]
MPSHPRFRRRLSSRRRALLLLAAALVVALSAVWAGRPYWQEREAGRRAVAAFLKLEQKGDYGSAWELFHPQMHRRFGKDAYIQKRAHVLMQDLGTKSFQYEIGKGETVRQLTVEAGQPPLASAYKVKVTLKLDTVFGRLSIVQEYYAVREAGKWKVLWLYGTAP